jgi:hypothetical protein
MELTHVKHVPFTAKIVRIGLANALHAIQPSSRQQHKIHAAARPGITQRHLTSAPNVLHIAQLVMTLLENALNAQMHHLQS